jgi:hypothetical protein
LKSNSLVIVQRGEFSTELGVNSNAKVREVRPKKSSSIKTPRKLQLRTNQSKTKYSISFENELSHLAKTDPGLSQYTTLIAESDAVFKGYEYDWKYILNKWIDNHKSAIGFKRSNFLFSSLTSSESKRTETKSSFYATTLDGKKYSVKLKPHIKCHFCKLVFESNKKRATHEKEWHSKK